MVNFSPQVWGRNAWSFLIYIVLSYPDNPDIDDINNMKNFLVLVGKLLPCGMCRNNYSEHLNKFPLDNNILADKNNLLNWLLNIHNEVNIKNNNNTLNLKEFLTKYIQNKNNGTNMFSNINPNIIIVLLSLFVILILIFIMKINKY
jgi:predicted PurR-regulated permease PerM